MSEIQITLPDNTVKQVEQGSTSGDVARSIGEGLYRASIAAKVNGDIVDLEAPIEKNTNVEILTNKNPEAHEILLHSSAHLLAQAIKELYPQAKIAIGPALSDRYYYDIDVDVSINEEELDKIEKKMKELSKQNMKVERVELSRNDALEKFKERNEDYKVEIISEIPEEDTISAYQQGDFIDLCRGPHVPSTGKIKHFKLLSCAGAYWRGDEKNKQLQRIYGVSFPKKKMLDEYLALLEEAKKRDHRKLGKQLDLFSIHEESGPGLIFWHPRGAIIRNTIEEFWKKEHLKSEYDLLYTPHVGRSLLWETSGHLKHFKENMFAPMKIDENEYFVKPMNCPFHILIYKSRIRSYRDLPLRWAELGTVYRYEKSGVLHGLLRVRGFTQDDAHIFCTHEQIEDEIKKVVQFSIKMWRDFGFEKMKFYVSTKPEKAAGDDALWEKATESLKKALESENLDYEVDEGGGAFYGPKIDIKIKDALNREWQMSTVQFDFNLPERFDMTYVGEDGKEHRPFMVHRALLGSLERFFGLLIEHYGGDFPLWLAPVQAAVIPVSQNFLDYARKVYENLLEDDIRVELDTRNEKIGYKIRDWENQKVRYMLIVGEKEQEENTVSVRVHKKGNIGVLSLSELSSKLKEEIKNKFTNN